MARSEITSGRIGAKILRPQYAITGKLSASRPGAAQKGKPCKPVLIAKAKAWMAGLQHEPRQGQVEDFIERAAWDMDESLSDGTKRKYALEALGKKGH